MSVNVYLVTEDLVEKKFMNKIYKVKGRELSKFNIDLLTELNNCDEINDLREIYNVLENIKSFFDKRMLKDDLDFEFYILDLLLEDKEFPDNQLLNDWLLEFRKKFLENDCILFYDYETNEYVFFEESEEENLVYYPKLFLPLVDDRIFNYGVGNIQSMYFPEMYIGYISPDIYNGLCLVNEVKKECVLIQNEYDNTITLNEFIDFIKKYTELEKAYVDDEEFFERRKNNFKEQLNLLLPYQKNYGHKKIFMFSIA